ncbi:MAG: glycosyltransferase family 2 protein [Capsulimonadaceae bacterium]
MAPSHLTVAVAMGVHNGERYLPQQLESIAAQARLPDEMVVCDDGSTDSSMAIVETFAAAAPFPVRLIRNDSNLGLARNFGKAISLCGSDIIALSDQDDVWLPGKLDVVVAAFESDPACSLVFTDADLVDEQLAPMGTRLSVTGRIGPAESAALAGPEAFAFLLRRNVATGATMALRRSLCDVALPIPEGLATYHDAWIVQIAAATGRVVYLPSPLVLYRQHPGQQTWDFVYVHHARKVLDRAHYAAHLRQLRALRGRLAAFAGTQAGCVERIDANITHLERRSALPSGLLLRLPAVAAELASGRYSTFSSGWRSALKDLVSGPGMDS